MGNRFAGAVVTGLMVLVGSGVSSAYAQRNSAPFDGYAFVSGYYDNNVFSYASQDRDLYNSGAPSNGKFPIESLSDFVTTLAVRGDYRWDIQKRSMWRIRLSYDGTLYARNSDRSYNRFGASLDRIMRRSRASLAVNYTPDFYLRHLYWRPMPQRPTGVRYAAATYNRLMVTANGSRRLSRTVDGNVMAGYAKRDYDFPFDERDNNTYMLGAGVDIDVTKRFDASVTLRLDLSSASGADSTNPAVEDVSNNRYGIDLEGTWRFTDRWSLVQGIGYGHQVYTTNNLADLPHHDRKDDDVTLTTELRMAPINGWQPQGFFQYRASNSTVAPGLAEFGQYRAFRVGAQVTYYF